MSTRNIWLNLPVKDINKSKEFYKTIGFTLNPVPGNPQDMASFQVGENNFVINLFPNDTFKSFAKNEIADTKIGTEVLINIDAQSKKEVDDMAVIVRKAGGEIFDGPGESQGWMYAFGFMDPDGHRWGVLFMDMSKMPGVQES